MPGPVRNRHHARGRGNEALHRIVPMQLSHHMSVAGHLPGKGISAEVFDAVINQQTADRDAQQRQGHHADEQESEEQQENSHQLPGTGLPSSAGGAASAQTNSFFSRSAPCSSTRKMSRMASQVCRSKNSARRAGLLSASAEISINPKAFTL